MNNWNKLEKTAVWKDVEQFYLHPDYKNTSHKNDIALVKLTSDLDLKLPALGSICVPDSSLNVNVLLVEKTCTATGWGEVGSNYYYNLKIKFWLNH